MFGWLGFRKGVPLWQSYRLNAGMKEDVENIFEGIAETRRELLEDWTLEYWGHLDRLTEQLSSLADDVSWLDRPDKTAWEQLFSSVYYRAVDFTEIFVLDRDKCVVYSTQSDNVGSGYRDSDLLDLGLRYCQGVPGGQKCLFGPYADPLTEKLGPRSSTFHDKMTLMFIVPVIVAGEWKGALCGRVPNDVIGDLIQRESGHVYPDSGDNYIFMAAAGLNTRIAPGTALSRSRFEDRTFTHGENLKDGVTTDWGTVSVKEHTELELKFTDPATGELHPGVANTIKNGSNLFVEFPGYSDYRHIPVIGKGVTFRLPHCPDLWGMMCEGDLEEVYRLRSIGWKQFKLSTVLLSSFALISAMLVYFIVAEASPILTALLVVGINVSYGLLAAWIMYTKGNRRVVDQLRRINQFIRINAEGKGDLTQRLDTSEFEQDELREMAKWINNMIDSLEGVMLQVKLAAGDVLASQWKMNESTMATEGATERVSGKINDMIGSIRRQLKDIDVAKVVAEEMRNTLRMLEEQASAQIAVAQGEVERIGEKMSHISDKVAETNKTISKFMETTKEIQSVLHVIDQISSQTNLLALNASIEAARVGEHGRGFAVVAGEIRKLADLTRKSTEEVHAIIDHIYENAKDAYSSMEEGTKVVDEGTKLVAAASHILSEATEGDTQKTQVIDEVVTLMERIADVSLENRAISTDVENKVQELLTDMVHVRHTTHHVEAITMFLQQLVGQFRLTETRHR